MAKNNTNLEPGQLVVTSQTITAYQVPSIDDIDPKVVNREKWTAVPKGVPLMVMKHYVFSGSVHSHFQPDRLQFSEVLIFLYEQNFFYISGDRPARQIESSLLGNRVMLLA